jgi:hypothetical protein
LEFAVFLSPGWLHQFAGSASVGHTHWLLRLRLVLPLPSLQPEDVSYDNAARHSLTDWAFLNLLTIDRRSVD